ncbi:MAG: nucleoside triphosphate pyrophosphohydrolase [Treponema sp.]|nr:nucleoside triphosphate pyrophosphohydrolase [Treponema sp.]
MISEKPDLNKREAAVSAFKRFLETIQTLRAPGGCPWDREQTPLSMRSDLIEESFEAIDAISQQDPNHAKEELGDLLLNTVMISYMYEQAGNFNIADSINELSDKLIRRHPHVWPQSEGKSQVKFQVQNPEEVLSQWDRIKENLEGRKSKSILDEVPMGFPPMLRAFKLLKKAAKKGFDWQSLAPVAEKVREELKEVEEARADFEEINKNHVKALTLSSEEEIDKAQLHVEEEVGDLLFAVINYARKLGVDPETALSRTNKKFYQRFTYVEDKMKENNLTMNNENLSQEEKFWDEAKSKGL